MAPHRQEGKSEMVEKVCPRCGHTFTCVVGEGCWCERVYLTKEILSKIRRQYMDCLCEKCLKSFGLSEN